MYRSALRAIVQIFLLALIVMSTTACAAVAQPLSSAFVPVTIPPNQILSIAPGSTLYGIVNALAQVPGTNMLVDAKEKFVIFSWPVQGIGTAWVQMKNTAAGWQELVASAGGKGNIANYDTWSSLLEYMKSPAGGGWVDAKPTVISASLITELLTVAGATVVSTAAEALPSIFMVPVINLPEFEQLMGNEIKS